MEVNNRVQSLLLNYLSASLRSGDFTIAYYQMGELEYIRVNSRVPLPKYPNLYNFCGIFYCLNSCRTHAHKFFHQIIIICIFFLICKLSITFNNNKEILSKAPLTINTQWLYTVFPVTFLNLGQFHKISQNWRSSCAKLIVSMLKIGSTRKSIFFIHFHKSR